MFADDDESEESATGALRYPVMPSLVALQQMRSRLHMAQLGRKLMKWTSVAAAAELRRISADLQAVYKTFAEDMKEAFILLARCRYFFPELNNIVVNDLQKEASVSVSSSMKTVSGVRLIQYRIVETDTPYDYLGLGTGGETIEEAKKAWVKLLKLQIQMVELRRSFMIVEDVHKTATKKMNVLGKVTVPRTLVTMKFIDTELDETDREEHYRLKKLQNKKEERARKAKNRTPVATIPEEVEETPPAPKTPALPPRPKEKQPTSKMEPRSPPPPPPKPESPLPPKPEEKPPTPKKEPPPPPSPDEKPADFEVLVELKEKVSNVIDLSKEISQKSVKKSVESFIQKAKEVKEILEGLTPGTVPSIKFKTPSVTSTKTSHEPSIVSSRSLPEPSTPAGTPSHPVVEATASSDYALGTFITEEEVITRYVKKKNPDGTITKEKRVITRKKIINSPATHARTPYIQRNVNYTAHSGKRNPNIMTAISTDLSKISLKSEYTKRVEAMSDPKERCCLSCIDILENSICNVSCQSFNLEEICDSMTCDENTFTATTTEMIIEDNSEIDFADDTLSAISGLSESERRLLSQNFLSEPTIKNDCNNTNINKSKSFDEDGIKNKHNDIK